jgi:hypothetical protein
MGPRPSIGKLEVAPSGRACIFCGGTPVTKEHLLGKWAGRFTDRDQRNVVQLLDREGSDRYERRWVARAYDRRAGVACQECNGGWMSDLELGVSRLLHPEALDGRPLTEDERGLLATWATKTALTLNAAESPERQIIAWDLARRFGRQRCPLENVRVWIASFTGGEDQVLALSASGIDLDDRQDGERGWRDVAVLTFVVGPFVFKVLVAGVPEAMAITLAPGGYVQQLWPVESAVVWRREPGLGLQEVVALAEQIPGALRNAGHVLRRGS